MKNQHVWVIDSETNGKESKEKRKKKKKDIFSPLKSTKNYNIRAMNNTKVGAGLIWNNGANKIIIEVK